VCLALSPHRKIVFRSFLQWQTFDCSRLVGETEYAARNSSGVARRLERPSSYIREGGLESAGIMQGCKCISAEGETISERFICRVKNAI